MLTSLAVQFSCALSRSSTGPTVQLMPLPMATSREDTSRCLAPTCPGTSRHSDPKADAGPSRYCGSIDKCATGFPSVRRWRGSGQLADAAVGRIRRASHRPLRSPLAHRVRGRREGLTSAERSPSRLADNLHLTNFSSGRSPPEISEQRVPSSRRRPGRQGRPLLESRLHLQRRFLDVADRAGGSIKGASRSPNRLRGIRAERTARQPRAASS